MVTSPKEIKNFVRWLHENYILFDIIKGKEFYKKRAEIFSIDQVIKEYEKLHKDIS